VSAGRPVFTHHLVVPRIAYPLQSPPDGRNRTKHPTYNCTVLESDDCADKTGTPRARDADDHVNRKQQVPAAEEEVDVYKSSVTDQDEAVNALTIVHSLLLDMKSAQLSSHVFHRHTFMYALYIGLEASEPLREVHENHAYLYHNKKDSRPIIGKYLTLEVSLRIWTVQ